MPPRDHTFGPLSTTRYAVNGVAFDTVRVPPGRFVDGEGFVDGPGVKRELLVSRPFEIGVTLVTQALWRAVTGKRPSNFQGDDRPVERVSWDDVQAFLGQIESLGLRGFRLPTEAEWVWAARCGVSTQWAGADRPKPVAVVDQFSTELVGKLRSSAAGALDFSGNAWERQQGWWSDVPDAGVDLQGPASGSYRVIRGGSWEYGPGEARVAFRDSYSLGGYSSDFGVRLLRSVP